ncbi:MAG: hypothetical protein K5705_06765 [Oscillospiraceae bacterium]|nr:hypothetical protein [Oscillospiraceae bacterium]
MKNIIKRIIPVSFLLLSAINLQGCAEKYSEDSYLIRQEKGSKVYSFADTYQNHSAKDYYCYRSLEGETMVMDYESMKNASLCSKPNCNHSGDACIVHRLNGDNPMFGENCAYYFVDDKPDIIYDNDEKKQKLKLGSSLCCYDFQTNNEKKLAHVDASVSDMCYGWMLYGETIYYIENIYGVNRDEAGNVLSYGNTGGTLSLHALRLSDLQNEKLCDLYDVDKLTQYYPLTPNSGEVYMKGLFENKIYFNVCFVDDADGQNNPKYRVYPTYYDLNDGTYHGTPEDYGNIDFSSVTYCSEDYLVICKEGQAHVWERGNNQAIVLMDERFDQDTFSLTAFDGMLFCFDCAFDLNTKEDRKMPKLQGKSVVAKYGDSYIISDYGMQENFEKIPAEELLK